MVNNEQVYFIVTFCCYIVAVGVLWRGWVIKPFKRWAAFMHQFSQACAVWLCCHKVTGIEVHGDEGGLTHWEGRNIDFVKHFVLPAGYLGNTAWGALALLSTTNDEFGEIMGLVLTGALGVCLFYTVCGEATVHIHRFEPKASAHCRLPCLVPTAKDLTCSISLWTLHTLHRTQQRRSH